MQYCAKYIELGKLISNNAKHLKIMKKLNKCVK